MCRRMFLPILLLGGVSGGTIGLAAPNERPAVSKSAPQAAPKDAGLVGFVEADETKLVRITARLKGRIDKLHVKLSGQKVNKGEPLAEVYSPDLTVTTQSLIDARRSGNLELERTASDRLRLGGMDNNQVEEILKSGKPVAQVTVRSPISGHVLRKHQFEGAYVKEGAVLFEVADLATVWIEAEVKHDADVLPLLGKLPIRVTAKAFPKREFSGETLGLFRDEKTLALKARFAVGNPREDLLPGMFATVLLDATAAQPVAKNAKLRELLMERLATLRVLVKATQSAYVSGKVSFDRLHQAQWAMLHAELELCDSDKERITVLEKAVALAKNFEKTAETRFQTGNATQGDMLLARAARLEAEIALERRRTKLPER